MGEHYGWREERKEENGKGAKTTHDGGTDSQEIWCQEKLDLDSESNE